MPSGDYRVMNEDKKTYMTATMEVQGINRFFVAMKILITGKLTFPLDLMEIYKKSLGEQGLKDFVRIINDVNKLTGKEATHD